MNKNFIPPKLYKKITATVPLSCVDLVIKRKNQFLLVRRIEKPAQNKWWFPGGRIFFNEKMESTVRRKLREEINVLKPKKIEFLGVGETMFKDGYFSKPAHTVNHVFLVEIGDKEGRQIKIDKTSSDYQWFSGIKKEFHPYMKEFLKKAKFK